MYTFVQFITSLKSYRVALYSSAIHVDAEIRCFHKNTTRGSSKAVLGTSTALDGTSCGGGYWIARSLRLASVEYIHNLLLAL